MTDVVERINELAAEEKCGHCSRQFHELALTRQVARMFDAGRFDADYFAREDTSPIVCDGSRFIGPRRPEPATATWTHRAYGMGISGGKSPAWTASLIDATWSYIGDLKVKTWLPGDSDGQSATLTFAIPDPGFAYFPSWNLGSKDGASWAIFDEWKKPEPVCPGPVPEVDVEFGPQNWLTEPHIYVPPVFKTKVLDRWQHFTKPEPTPVPASPGYDFTAFQGDEPKYPTSKKGNRYASF